VVQLFSVPETKCDVKIAVGITDTRDAVFAPAIGSLTRMVMTEV
jgi:hypothetical protein